MKEESERILSKNESKEERQKSEVHNVYVNPIPGPNVNNSATTEGSSLRQLPPSRSNILHPHRYPAQAPFVYQMGVTWVPFVSGSSGSEQCQDEVNPEDDNEFLNAAMVGNAPKMRAIIREARANLFAANHLGRTALHLAAADGSLVCVKIALDVGIDPNRKDKIGMTALTINLMRCPSLAIANILFQHGATIPPRETSMETGLFLQFAMMCRPTDEEKKILRLLVEQGAEINDHSAPGERQALHFAAMSNNCELIELIVELGADLFITNDRGETPREVAISFQCKEAATLLAAFEDEAIARDPSLVQRASKQPPPLPPSSDDTSDTPEQTRRLSEDSLLSYGRGVNYV